MMRANYKIVKCKKTEIFYEIQTEFGHKAIHRFNERNKPNIEIIEPPRPLTETELSMLNNVLSKHEYDDLEGA